MKEKQRITYLNINIDVDILYAKANPTSPAQHQTTDRTGDRAKEPTAPEWNCRLGGHFGSLGVIRWTLGCNLGSLWGSFWEPWGCLGVFEGHFGSFVRIVWSSLVALGCRFLITRFDSSKPQLHLCIHKYSCMDTYYSTYN